MKNLLLGIIFFTALTGFGQGTQASFIDFQRTLARPAIAMQNKLDTLQKQFGPTQAVLNDIIKVKIRTASPVPYDSYRKLDVNGSAILIDETSHVTVGACMIQ